MKVSVEWFLAVCMDPVRILVEYVIPQSVNKRVLPSERLGENELLCVL